MSLATISKLERCTDRYRLRTDRCATVSAMQRGGVLGIIPVFISLSVSVQFSTFSNVCYTVAFSVHAVSHTHVFFFMPTLSTNTSLPCSTAWLGIATYRSFHSTHHWLERWPNVELHWLRRSASAWSRELVVVRLLELRLDNRHLSCAIRSAT